MAKLSSSYNDDTITAMIIKNIKTYNSFIWMLDAFDQAGHSNIDLNSNCANTSWNQTSYPKVYGEISFSNGNNLRRYNQKIRTNQYNFWAVANWLQQNYNCNVNHRAGHNQRRVYHCRKIVKTPYRGAVESNSSEDGDLGVQPGVPATHWVWWSRMHNNWVAEFNEHVGER